MENNSQPNVAAVSDRGLSEKRPTNEDSYLVLSEKGVFAVADGVGGAQAGDVASQMAMEILAEAFTHYGDSAPPDEILRVAIERANQAVFQMASELPQLASMATTIVAMHLKGDVATIAHVGDSRIYRVDPEGNIEQETLDHSVVEEEVRAGRMTAEQAANHPSRNVISRAVGAESTVQVDIKTIMAAPGSSFILCSDGITRHITDAEIAHILTSGMTPETIGETMKDLCYERGAEDNLTAVIVQLPRTAADAATDAPGAVPFEETAVPAPPVVEHVEEEETIATVRTPFDAPADEQPAEQAAVEMAAPPPSEEDDEQYLLDQEVFREPEAELPTAPPEDYTSESVTVPAVPAPLPVATEPIAEREFSMFGESAEEPKAKKASGGAGTLLSALLWLVVGAALGAGGYYLWQQYNPPVVEQPAPTPVLVEKSEDIQLSALEEARRLVDSDPQGYLNAKAAQPSDAVDFYLLGRAMLLTGREWDAKRQFDFAKQRLQDVDERDRKTLAAEIAMASAIIGSGPASEAFKRELAAQGVAPVTEANTNPAAPPANNDPAPQP